MARLVVEPAIVVKWFVPEEHSSPAARLLDGGSELMAPDTLLADSGKIISTKARLGELSHDESVQILEAIRSAPLRIQPSDPLMEPALRIASALDLPLRLAVAIHGDCRLVTARQVLYERVQGTPFAQHVKWVGDIR
jgi:predicted nucleic acid-binding protein